LTIDGIPKSFEAKVYAIDPKVDMNTRTIVARALYPNTNEELEAGPVCQCKGHAFGN
jgi:membrane fusion protein, multidrug efflux system